jgi:glutamyl-tRNA reductase
MTVLSLGISFRTAPIELREQLSLDEGARAAALNRFREWRRTHLGPDAELAILSTCNRLELYLAAPGVRADEVFAALTRFTAELSGLRVEHLRPYLNRYDDVGAVRHLCRVAAGLDSMVLGESQVLGQVSAACEAAVRVGSIGPTLSAVFRTAIRAGRRAQTETTIGQNPASVGSVAVHVAERVMGQAALHEARVLVVGAGEMAELVVKALHARGVRHLVVANRTHAHAVALARRWGGAAVGLDQLEPALGEADIAITSTGAPRPIIVFDHVQRAMQMRPDRSLVLIDIAVPRDVEPSVSNVRGIRLFNLDDLQAYLEGSISERRQQVPLVEAILGQELEAFEAGLRGADVNPVIAGLRKKAEAIRQHELERALRHLPDLDPQTRDYIQGMTRALMNKLLHEPTSRLRAAADDGHGAEYAESVRYLFGLVADEPLGAADPDETRQAR